MGDSSWLYTCVCRETYSFAGVTNVFNPQSDLPTIRRLSEERGIENDAFRNHLQRMEGDILDDMVKELNTEIAPLIDCTACGACCRSLMINVTSPEIEIVAEHLNMPGEQFKREFVETSEQGQMIINTIPCHFLAENKCTVYEKRFNECREFPHLHKGNMKTRMFGLLIHYGMCPIIFNVLEVLKLRTGFNFKPHKVTVENT